MWIVSIAIKMFSVDIFFSFTFKYLGRVYRAMRIFATKWTLMSSVSIRATPVNEIMDD